MVGRSQSREAYLVSVLRMRVLNPNGMTVINSATTRAQGPYPRGSRKTVRTGEWEGVVGNAGFWPCMLVTVSMVTYLILKVTKIPGYRSRRTLCKPMGFFRRSFVASLRFSRG